MRTDGAEDFIRGFEDMNERFLDIVYDEERLHDQPEPVLPWTSSFVVMLCGMGDPSQGFRIKKPGSGEQV